MNNNTSIWKQEKKNTQDDSLFLEVESFLIIFKIVNIWSIVMVKEIWLIV